ncbi:CDP-alcohol phosphatidyltransferase family protein [Prevotella sp. OH937_COT-195]|uniref:CDP-alcohol phosphatidyltransferase family protein n=1 Tax=Prevotella sp. OH937_COT-195 TaxID=2491051 RepID=UPI000F654BC8|nr:CDP-alcohol phosphatidyltransferase family protein [Prevotella sp. OH937_COT-195]RRD02047.1 CDP-alcohol phosphatidyltransferase family protein [Prevotella sp. OH937_COT-195]
MGKSFNEMLRASLKSKDTEEWIDVYFTRPIGLVFAILWNKLGIHPNVITVLSIFLGIGAGVMFGYTDLQHNIIGVLLLMFANFCDSTDGQMARLTGKKTLLGRVLDGFSGDIWFFGIYAAICIRMFNQYIPGTDVKWHIWIWLLAFVAGIMSHSPQSSLADYYRQIHLFFIKGKENSELDNYKQQRAVYEQQPKNMIFARLFYYNYANYCKSQEKRTPNFQKMMNVLMQKHGDAERMPAELKDKFVNGSRPLMKYANILTFNVRAITLYATCLLDCPWVYLLVEIIVLNILYIYMHKRHEALCAYITERL